MKSCGCLLARFALSAGMQLAGDADLRGKILPRGQAGARFEYTAFDRFVTPRSTLFFRVLGAFFRILDAFF